MSQRDTSEGKGFSLKAGEVHNLARMVNVNADQMPLGIEVQYHTRGGRTIQSEKTFDSRGLTAAQSAPHFSTESAVSTQFTYDTLGRVTQTRRLLDGVTCWWL